MSDIEKLTVTNEKPADWRPSERGSLGTETLPVEVTSQPIAVSVWSTTEGIGANGRPEGWFSISLSIAGRKNPIDLTPDEREYVASALEKAAALFRDRGQPFAETPTA